MHPPIDEPAHRAAWRDFLRQLVDRYGPRGSLWTDRQVKRPIRDWQIWNEPNFDRYWHPSPSPREYARLLAISARTIHRRAPRARIVLGGVAPVTRSGIPWWKYLRRLYDVPGVRRDFDVAALHPYSPTIRDLRGQLRLARKIMRDSGDSKKPLAVTEFGWASRRGREPLLVGRNRQAALLTQAFRVFEQPRWRVVGADWYAWRDAPLVEPGCYFCEQSGLFLRSGAAKPAWKAFKRAARPALPRP